jgi:O-antigen ligase
MFVTKRRVLGLVAVIVIGVAIQIMAPSGYFERMETVATFDEDNSAQGRIEAWTRATQMAFDYPLGVGAGNFPSSYGRHYIDLNATRIGYGAQRWINAHSIYFRVLGEYGFIGLTMLLWIIFGSIRANIAVGRVLLQHPDPPLDPLWPALVNMSIVGFAVAGIFLGGFDFPHLFLLAGLTIANRRVAARLAAAPVQTVGREIPPVLAAAIRLPARGGVRALPPPRRAHQGDAR